MTTALFIFADGCGACTFYKETIHAQVLNLFSKLGITSEEFTYNSLEGFSADKVKYSFLSDVTFFPCIMLIKTSALQEFVNGTFIGDIFFKLFVLNGTVVAEGTSPRIRTIDPQVYNSEVNSFERFYKDFLHSNAAQDTSAAKSASHSRERIVQKSENRDIIYPSKYSGQGRMQVCGGIRAVPTSKK